jgi:hypothetical protein
MSQPGYPERSWRFGCNFLHRDPIPSRIRLMPLMKPEPGALVLALGGQHLQISVFLNAKGQ